MVDFPTAWRDVWNDWDVRVFLLISLLMQMLLIIFAPLRRRKSSRSIILFVWSIYLLADWAAIFTLGLLCNGQGKSVSGNYDHTANARNINNIGVAAAGSKRSKLGLKYDEKLTAFWAPFLLLHLGGPDAITAFAMEDNELWLRHFLGALIEVGAAVYAFLQSLPKNELFVPTILMFLAGIIKYGERTYALYLGSLDGFRDSIAQEDNPGPDYEKLIDKQQYMNDCGVRAWIHIEREEDVRQSTRFVEKGDESGDEIGEHDLEGSLIVAYKLFNMFKGILVDLIFGVRERNESRQIFLHSHAGEAFRIVELELSFLYEVLFTKAAVVHHRYGYVLRAICSCSIMAAFVSFFFVSRRHAIDKLDLAITYTLLGGAICLDIFSFVCLILSDWTVVKVKRCSLLHMIFSFFLRVQPHERWSVTVTQHSLINYCIPKKPTYLRRIMDRPTLFGKVDEMLCIQKMLRLTGMGAQLIDEIQYTWHEDVTYALKEHIYQQLKKKAWNVESGWEARNACSFRGDRALEERGYLLGAFRNAVEVEFHESLILWHLATDLCYYIGEENDGMDEPEAISVKASMHRRFCKLLSDYLMYLLVMRPSMMSSSALLGKIRYRDTCAEAKRFFLRRNNAEEIFDNSAVAKRFFLPRNIAEQIFKERQITGCKVLRSSTTKLKSSGFSNEDESKSMLVDGCALFENLKQLKAVKRWEMMSEVWIEMLAYAAGRCPSIAHAQMLSQGGELLSFVWLLLTHLGMGEHYQISNGPPRAKIIVEK